MRNPISTSAEPHVTPFPHAVARFEDQFCIGTVYALSMLKAKLPRPFGILYVWSFAAFGITFQSNGFTSLHSGKLKLSILIGS